MTQTRRTSLVVLGQVDHGKSTIVGRLLADTNTLPPGAIEELERVSRRRGMAIEWSFALDALQAERDQAITIDCTQVRLRAGGREILIIDAPGHEELLGQMISGAAQAGAALLVVDAAEGVAGQSRRHAYLARFLSIRTFVVAVNKMDLVGFDGGRFADTAAAITAEFERLSLPAPIVVPVAARDGDNLATRSTRMPWYTGPTLLERLIEIEPPPASGGPLRLPVQDVYKFDERRIVVGRIESGVLSAGDRLLFSPSGRTARVASIERWNSPATGAARAGDVVGFTVDAPVLVERGDVASHLQDAPVLADEFRAHVVWLGERPLSTGDTLIMKTNTAETMVSVASISDVFDLESLQLTRRAAPPQILRGEAGWIRCHSRAFLAVDSHASLPKTGRCVFIDGAVTVAAGLLDLAGCGTPGGERAAPDHVARTHHQVSPELRAMRYGHRGAVIWLTGLSASGKSTIAMAAEAHLFRKGYRVYALDGDNLRRGINADLCFSPADRRENIRRSGEIAALFAEAGLVVLAAFISPDTNDRALARAAAGDRFHEIYVRASLATCEARDPRGLYRAARAGDIAHFTGVSAPYEPPGNPDLMLDTDRLSVDEAVEQLVAYIGAATTVELARSGYGLGSFVQSSLGNV